jgi:hypothetical protein
MTGLDLDRLGFHPIGHEALELGRDRPVFRGEGGFDRQAACVVLPEKQGVRDPSLHGVEDACLSGLDIAGEIPEGFLAQLSIIFVRADKIVRFDRLSGYP